MAISEQQRSILERGNRPQESRDARGSSLFSSSAKAEILASQRGGPTGGTSFSTEEGGPFLRPGPAIGSLEFIGKTLSEIKNVLVSSFSGASEIATKQVNYTESMRNYLQENTDMSRRDLTDLRDDFYGSNKQLVDEIAAERRRLNQETLDGGGQPQPQSKINIFSSLLTESIEQTDILGSIEDIMKRQYEEAASFREDTVKSGEFDAVHEQIERERGLVLELKERAAIGALGFGGLGAVISMFTSSAAETAATTAATTAAAATTITGILTTISTSVSGFVSTIGTAAVSAGTAITGFATTVASTAVSVGTTLASFGTSVVGAIGTIGTFAAGLSAPALITGFAALGAIGGIVSAFLSDKLGMFTLGKYLPSMKKSALEAQYEKFGGENYQQMSMMAEFTGRRFDSARYLLLDAVMITRMYDTNEEKMLGLTSGIYTLLRESTGWAITTGQYITGLEDSVIGTRIPFKDGLFDRMGRFVQSIPVLSQLVNTALLPIKGIWKSIKFTSKFFSLENPVLKWARDRMKTKEVTAAEVLEEAGLNMTLQDRAYTFLSDGLPEIANEQLRFQKLQFEVSSNIFNATRELLASFGKSIEYQEDKALREEKVWNVLAGKNMTLEEEVEFRTEVEEKVQAAAQRLGVGQNQGFGFDVSIFGKKPLKFFEKFDEGQFEDSIQRAMVSTYKQQAVQMQEQKREEFKWEQEQLEKEEATKQKREMRGGLILGGIATALTGGAAAPLVAAFTGAGLIRNIIKSKEFKEVQEEENARFDYFEKREDLPKQLLDFIPKYDLIQQERELQYEEMVRIQDEREQIYLTIERNLDVLRDQGLTESEVIQEGNKQFEEYLAQQAEEANRMNDQFNQQKELEEKDRLKKSLLVNLNKSARDFFGKTIRDKLITSITDLKTVLVDIRDNIDFLSGRKALDIAQEVQLLMADTSRETRDRLITALMISGGPANLEEFTNSLKEAGLAAKDGLFVEKPTAILMGEGERGEGAAEAALPLDNKTVMEKVSDAMWQGKERIIGVGIGSVVAESLKGIWESRADIAAEGSSWLLGGDVVGSISEAIANSDDTLVKSAQGSIPAVVFTYGLKGLFRWFKNERLEDAKDPDGKTKTILKTIAESVGWTEFTLLGSLGVLSAAPAAIGTVLASKALTSIFFKLKGVKADEDKEPDGKVKKVIGTIAESAGWGGAAKLAAMFVSGGGLIAGLINSFGAVLLTNVGTIVLTKLRDNKYIGPALEALGEKTEGLRDKIFGGVSSVVSSIKGKFPGRRFGGPVEKGKPYTVNEEGEETFIPDQDGTIIPSEKTKKGIFATLKEKLLDKKEVKEDSLLEKMLKFTGQEANLLGIGMFSADTLLTIKDLGTMSKLAIELFKDVGSQELVKEVGKNASFLAKASPFVGPGLGLLFAALALKDSDYFGAALELSSGAASMVPGLGTALSAAIDMGIRGRKWAKKKEAMIEIPQAADGAVIPIDAHPGEVIIPLKDPAALKILKESFSANDEMGTANDEIVSELKGIRQTTLQLVGPTQETGEFFKEQGEELITGLTPETSDKKSKIQSRLEEIERIDREEVNAELQFERNELLRELVELSKSSGKTSLLGKKGKKGLLGWFGGLFSSLGGSIASILGGLIGWKLIKGFIKRLFVGADGKGGIWNWFKEGLKKLGSKIWGLIKKPFVWMGSKISGFFGDMFGRARQWLAKVNPFKGLGARVTGFFGDIFTGAGKWIARINPFKGLGTWIGNMFSGIFSNFTKLLPSAGGSILKTGLAFLKKIPIVGHVLTLIFDMIPDMFSGWKKEGIGGFIKGIFSTGGDSPWTRIFKGMGKYALIGAVAGSVFPVVGNIIGGGIGMLVGGIIGWFSDGSGNIVTKAIDALKNNIFVPLLESFVSPFVNIYNTFKDWWEGRVDFGEMLSGVADFTLGLVTFPFRALGNVVNKITGGGLGRIGDWLLSKITDTFPFLKSFIGSGSPDKPQQTLTEQMAQGDNMSARNLRIQLLEEQRNNATDAATRQAIEEQLQKERTARARLLDPEGNSPDYKATVARIDSLSKELALGDNILGTGDRIRELRRIVEDQTWRPWKSSEERELEELEFKVKKKTEAVRAMLIKYRQRAGLLAPQGRTPAVATPQRTQPQRPTQPGRSPQATSTTIGTPAAPVQTSQTPQTRTPVSAPGQQASRITPITGNLAKVPATDVRGNENEVLFAHSYYQSLQATNDPQARARIQQQVAEESVGIQSAFNQFVQLGKQRAQQAARTPQTQTIPSRTQRPIGGTPAQTRPQTTERLPEFLRGPLGLIRNSRGNLSDIIGGIRSIISDTAQSAQRVVAPAVQRVQQAAPGIAQRVQTGASNLLQRGRTAVQQDAATPLGQQVQQGARNVIQGISQTASNVADSIRDTGIAIADWASRIPDRLVPRPSMRRAVAGAQTAIQQFGSQLDPLQKRTLIYEGLPTDAEGNVTSYMDSRGFRTIGVGHLNNSPRVFVGDKISFEQAMDLYVNKDFPKHQDIAKATPWWGAHPNLDAVLTDLSFNMPKAFRWRTTKRYLDAGDLDGFGQWLTTIPYARQVGQRAIDNANLLIQAGNIQMPSLEVGTNFVKRDGPHYLHRGERVIPEEINRNLRNVRNEQFNTITPPSPAIPQPSLTAGLQQTTPFATVTAPQPPQQPIVVPIQSPPQVIQQPSPAGKGDFFLPGDDYFDNLVNKLMSACNVSLHDTVEKLIGVQ